MSIVQARVPVVWRPQPRQAEFMSRPEAEALYGGAAGGGIGCRGPGPVCRSG